MALFTWHNGIVPHDMEIKQVYGILFSIDGRILLIVDKTKDAMYSFAGGRPESEDNGIEDTLRREVFEEVNISISKPIIVGYQEVDEEDGSMPFAQVRMAAIIDKIGKKRPDIDNGKTYERLLVPAYKAIELLQWGDVGYEQIMAAKSIAENVFCITEISDTEEYI